MGKHKHQHQKRKKSSDNDSSEQLSKSARHGEQSECVSEVLCTANTVLYGPGTPTQTNTAYPPVFSPNTPQYEAGVAVLPESPTLNCNTPPPTYINLTPNAVSVPNSADQQTTMASNPTNADIMAYLTRIDSKLSVVDKKLETLDKLEKTVDKVEKKVDNFENELKQLWVRVEFGLKESSDKFKHVNERLDAEFRQMNDKLKTMETQISDRDLTPRSELDTMRNLCFKCIEETDADDSVDNLIECVERVLTAINVDVKIVCARRVGDRSAQVNGRHNRPRPAIVTLESTAQRIVVLRAKNALRLNDAFKSIYIEPDKTRHERIVEANMRTIARKIGGLRVRGGRIIDQQ
ncbi:MAG: hypothetical protein ABW185_10640 [Sedimenticola sp.]